MLDPVILGGFPNLSEGNYLETSPWDPTYNCIAHAAGDQNRWWWPSESFDSYWPAGVSREETVDAFVQAYATLGYSPSRNGLAEPGIEKIAIYAAVSFGKITPTHAARQLPNGNWTSKLGTVEDIEHRTVDGVEGPVYGSAVIYLERPRP